MAAFYFLVIRMSNDAYVSWVLPTLVLELLFRPGKAPVITAILGGVVSVAGLLS